MGKLPEWVLRLVIEQLARFITPELVETLKEKALEYVANWASKLPAGLGQVVVAIAKAVLENDHDQAAKGVICWAKGQVAETTNKIDDAVVDVLAHALNVDPNSCPVHKA